MSTAELPLAALALLVSRCFSRWLSSCDAWNFNVFFRKPFSLVRMQWSEYVMYICHAAARYNYSRNMPMIIFTLFMCVAFSYSQCVQLDGFFCVCSFVPVRVTIQFVIYYIIPKCCRFSLSAIIHCVLCKHQTQLQRKCWVTINMFAIGSSNGAMEQQIKYFNKWC